MGKGIARRWSDLISMRSCLSLVVFDISTKFSHTNVRKYHGF